MDKLLIFYFFSINEFILVFLFALYFSVLIGLALYVTLNMKKKIIRKHINFLLEFPNNNKLCQHINFETPCPKYKIMYVQVPMYVHVYVMCMGVQYVWAYNVHVNKASQKSIETQTRRVY
jgi:hypothetical protein